MSTTKISYYLRENTKINCPDIESHTELLKQFHKYTYTDAGYSMPFHTYRENFFRVSGYLLRNDLFIPGSNLLNEDTLSLDGQVDLNYYSMTRVDFIFNMYPEQFKRLLFKKTLTNLPISHYINELLINNQLERVK